MHTVSIRPTTGRTYFVKLLVISIPILGSYLALPFCDAADDDTAAAR